MLPNAVKPSVAQRYLVSVRQLEPTFGTMRVPEITRQAIGLFISRRTLAGATNATIRRDLTALSRLLSACVSWGWCEENPARFYDRSIIRERRKPIEPPRRQDVSTFLAACSPGVAAVLRLLDVTGMREAEVVSLAADQIDWEGRTITLTRTKTSRPRTLPFSTPGGDAGAELADKTRVTGPLFLSSLKRPYSMQSFAAHVSERMGDIAEREAKAGRPFKRFRVHDLRHGFAIRALKAGMGIYALSRHLGHTSVKTTEIYLGFLTTDQAQQAMQAGAQKVAQSG